MILFREMRFCTMFLNIRDVLFGMLKKNKKTAVGISQDDGFLKWFGWDLAIGRCKM